MIIYSRTRIEGKEGRYIDPRFFSGVVATDKVLTDDPEIAKAYKDAGVEVEAITEKKPSTRKAKGKPATQTAKKKATAQKAKK